MSFSYRTMLKQELDSRCSRNPAYSLRAFAKTLKLNAPHLSNVLQGKRGLSAASADRIADILQLSSGEKQLFCDMVSAQHARKRSERSSARARIKTALNCRAYKKIEIDQFKLISDWHHFAILHLLEVKGFQSSVGWIADKLSIPKSDVADALDRLENLRLIDRSSSPWRIKNKFTSTQDVPSGVLRSHHHQILAKAGEALDNQASGTRDFSAITMSVDDSQISDAKKWIRNFRRKFCTDMDKSENKNEIYCLAIQFFRLSK